MLVRRARDGGGDDLLRHRPRATLPPRARGRHLARVARLNLFVAGRSPVGQLRQALARLLEQLPFFPDSEPASWSHGELAAAWIAHPPERVGGVRYAQVESERLALFSGRPFRWTDGDETDGLGPLDAALYLRPASEWFASLDGRFAAVRCSGGTVEAVSDRLGAYPLYRAGELYSNSAELARLAAGLARRPSPAVLASLLGGGWSLTGDPAWEGVERVRGAEVATPVGRRPRCRARRFEAARSRPRPR